MRALAVRPEIDKSIVSQLLGDFNWRMRSVGARFATYMNYREFEDIIGVHLLKSEVCYAAGFFHLGGLLPINCEAKPILFCAVCWISVQDFSGNNLALRFNRAARVTARLALRCQFLERVSSSLKMWSRTQWFRFSLPPQCPRISLANRFAHPFSGGSELR